MRYTDVDIPLYIERENLGEDRKKELLHWHNSIEIVEVEEGSICCHIDGNTFNLDKGDSCVINRGRMHRIDEGSTVECRKRTFIFDPGYVVRNEAIYNKYIQPMFNEGSFSYMKFRSKSSIGSEIFRLVDEIDRENTERTEGYELEVLALAYMIIRRLYQEFTGRKEISKEGYDSDRQIQRRMTSFIYENYFDKLTLDDIANAGSVSKSKCTKLFHEYAGKSPVDFLNSYRLELSSYLLKETDKRISDIAQECGFSQQSYYNRMFLREFGYTPKEYRRLLRKH